ncbi:MAG: alpha/beta hydrolase [Candidatus Obscuribacterales bacterium]|nr:alpha/beta hydrolase [Candidatus Obscuribacterales bacterium]
MAKPKLLHATLALLCIFAGCGNEQTARAQTAESNNPLGSALTERSQRRVRIRQFLDKRGEKAGLEGRSKRLQAKEAAIDTTKVAVQHDLAYGKEPRQKLDVYAPKDKKTLHPIVLFVHGGGWRVGNKSQQVDKGAVFASNGVVFVSTNYRLAPEVQHPLQIQDIASAFAWVKKHAAEFGGDPDKIFLMGHSAGAQLVDLLGTNDRFLLEQELSLKDVKGVISLDTASLNLGERSKESTAEGAMVGDMIKSAFGTDPKVLADASPTLCIKTGKSYPPFLMFCGERRTSCVAQHGKFEAALKKAGGTVKVYPVPLSHGAISQAAGQEDTDIFKKSMALIKSGAIKD